MKTKYITTLTAQFNPFSPTSKVPRLFLTLLPANAHKSIKITTKQLPRSSAEPAFLEIGLKDGKSMKYSWSDKASIPATDAGAAGKTKKPERVKLQDIVEQVERHARGLLRKEELTG